MVYIDTGEGQGYTRSVTKEEISISVLPSLPSTPSRVPYGHGTKSSILYLHSPTVRPKVIVQLSGDPLIQDSLTWHVQEDVELLQNAKDKYWLKLKTLHFIF